MTQILEARADSNFWSKADSVTDMLFTLKLPSFDTILHNGKQQFVLSILRSGNNLIDTVRVLI